MRRIGTQLKLKDDEKTKLIEALNFWRDKALEYYESRNDLEERFFCRWEGQHPCGLVLSTDEEQAWPFHGASDQRVRLGDKIFQKQYALIAVALSACTIEVTAMGKDADRRAENILALLYWMIDNLGSHGWAQIRALIHYFMVDSPAIAGMDVDWEKTWSLHVEEAGPEDLLEEFTAWIMSTDPQMSDTSATEMFWKEIEDAQEENGETTYVADFLVKAKGVRQKDAKRIVKALGEDDGRVEFLSKGMPHEGIGLEALRYGDDFCIPIACERFEYANPWFRGEWVTEEQLRERVANDGWNEKWVEDTLQWPQRDFYNNRNESTEDEDYKDLYNICWCYMAETNDDGETVRYVTVLSFADGSAFGKRVVSSRRGTWPVVLFRREVLSTEICEGRGLAELCCPDQGIIKEIKDRANDAAIIGSLPPVLTKGTKASNAIIEPFGKVPMGTSDEVKFMTPPQFPATAKDREKEIENDLLDYIGISNGETDVSDRTKAFVKDMLLQFRDLFVKMIETAQDNASDEVLAGVTDDGDVKGLKREDITGRFGIKLKLDPNNLNEEKLNKKLTTFSQILGMDKRQEVDTSPVLRHALHTMFPEISKRSIKTADQLMADDLANEQENFVKIKAGVMPQMNTEGGWNYEARLKFWQDLQQQNPDAIAEMSPVSQQMMQQWIAALEQQNTQFGKNAEIGKTGVQGVTAE